MGNVFCKFQDSANKKYVFIDDNAQPLKCNKDSGKCEVHNMEEYLHNYDKYKYKNEDYKEEHLITKTNLSCDYDNDGIIKNSIEDIAASGYKSAVFGLKSESEEDIKNAESMFNMTYANNGSTEEEIYRNAKISHEHTKSWFHEEPIEDIESIRKGISSRRAKTTEKGNIDSTFYIVASILSFAYIFILVIFVLHSILHA